MLERICIIGFGEVAQTVVSASSLQSQPACYDIKTNNPRQRSAKERDYHKTRVRGCSTLAEALGGADVVLSVVTADQALAAAKAAAHFLPQGALYCDMNSVAPDTKIQAAQTITDAGGQYVDVAIMSPIMPLALKSPLLLSGPRAEEGQAAMQHVGFTKTKVVGDHVGQASITKMIRSVMVKGLEALTAECVLAANTAGVLEDVAGTFEEGWLDKANYRLERMIVHGERRAAEMEEVVRTLDALGAGSVMSQGTVARQSALGALGHASPALCLQGKLASLSKKEEAA
ncbi:MAG: DUF1932 domain-containing protein [Pseudomonadota bacterium]